MKLNGLKFFISAAIMFTGLNTYAGTVYCMGGEISLDINNQTISSSVLGLSKARASITHTVDQDGRHVFTAISGSIVAISTPDNKSGWSGQANTVATDLQNKKSATSECNLN
jgi:hypothetical protein